MDIDALETPVAVIDLDKLQANIARLQEYMDEHGIENRPHIKTHKIPEIAHMQIAAGAVGIACQKLSEAEVMAQAGIRDIFLPYNILGDAKLERLVRLARRIALSVTADSEVTIRGLSAAMARSGMVLPVLVEFDIGDNRCGVQTPQEAADLAKIIAHSPGLVFGGLMTFPLNDRVDPFVAETRRLLAPAGITVERVSVGSSANMYKAHLYPSVTEYRAGQYVYGDRGTVRSGAMSLDDCSFQVIATVVSRPTHERGILDAGSKTLSSDLGSNVGYGLILEYPAAKLFALSEEHGHADFSECPHKPEIGERVTIIPNHCCPVSNLLGSVVGARNGQVEVFWDVAARGTVQ